MVWREWQYSPMDVKIVLHFPRLSIPNFQQRAVEGDSNQAFTIDILNSWRNTNHRPMHTNSNYLRHHMRKKKPRKSDAPDQIKLGLRGRLSLFQIKFGQCRPWIKTETFGAVILVSIHCSGQMSPSLQVVQPRFQRER